VSAQHHQGDEPSDVRVPASRFRSSTRLAQALRWPSITETSINVRLPPGELAALDAFVKQDDPKPSRPEALRRFAQNALSTRPAKRGVTGL
ncbi:MAG TPA: hypothetical protein VHS97_10710, partial [Isosphaeraceae bacterium]|nr:hypothetical protein [Isosphaeraceae bacterium]